MFILHGEDKRDARIGLTSTFPCGQENDIALQRRERRCPELTIFMSDWTKRVLLAVASSHFPIQY
jgi:hypothetical protein